MEGLSMAWTAPDMAFQVSVYDWLGVFEKPGLTMAGTALTSAWTAPTCFFPFLFCDGVAARSDVHTRKSQICPPSPPPA